MEHSRVLVTAAALVASLATRGFAQTTDTAKPPPPATAPAASSPAAPAEVMPPAARTGSGSASPNATVDATFVRDAGAAGLAEVRLGQLAAQQAQSAQVKAFGQRMVADHTRLSERLAVLARQKGFPMPSTLDQKDDATLKELTNEHGTSFDNDYVRSQVSDHQSALTLFEREATHGTDHDLKQFASDALPTLRQHLRMAQTAANGGA